MLPFLLLLIAVGTYTCNENLKGEKKDALSVILDWNKHILAAEVNTEGYRGPVAARAYGYVGLAGYEAGLPGLEGDFISMASRYPGLTLPGFPPKEYYNMQVALNECYGTIVSMLFLSAPENIKRQRAVLQKSWHDQMKIELDSNVMKASTDYGRKVAEAVYNWSATDSLGYRSNHHNYDRNHVPPVGDGMWVSSVDFPMPPLLPYWGKVRPFVIRTEDYLARALPPFTTNPDDLYHRQALEIMTLTKPLSSENKWIADFWNDDRPGLTFSPAGHWLAITNQVIEKERPSVEKALETYLKVGFCLADAMIACFYSKYIFNLLRPETYIQQHLDRTWRPYSPSPSFPSYPSGHSMMGAAAAEVLTDMYGARYKLTDKSHEGLKDFQVKPRTFNSFDEMARENAMSRVFMGVHWRFDCEEGLRLGTLIGKQTVTLKVENKLTK